MPHVASAIGIVLASATIASLNEALPYFEITLLNDTGLDANTTRLGVDTGCGGVFNATLTIDNQTSGAADFTLDVVVETSADNLTWRPALNATDDAPTGAFPQQTADGSVRKTFVVDRYVRATATIGGTAPVSCDVTLVGNLKF